MESYNDYYGITKEYLRNYQGFTLAVDSLINERRRLEGEYNDLKKPIAKYGLEPGGENELTTTEQYAEKRIAVCKEMNKLGIDITALQVKIMQLDEALKTLTDIERKIIDLRFNKRMPWCEVAAEVGYSEVGCKKRGYSIVRTLTWKLFGHRMFVKKNFHFVS